MTVITQKLGYEWRQIYRDLAQKDVDDTGLVSVKDFQDSCRKTGTNISKEEVSKLVKKYRDRAPGESGAFENESNLTWTQTEMNYGKTFIHYKQLSEDLGLHKSSYNFLSKIQKDSKIKNINKLRQLYQTIETGKT